MIELGELERQVLVAGRDDHIGLWWVLGEISDRLPSADSAALREMTLSVIGDLLRRGLVKAGFPTREGRGFDAWSTTAEEIISRIDSEWRALGRAPNIGEIVWLTTTKEGARLTKEIKAREA